MAIQHSTAVRNAMADAFETATGTAPKLQLRTGAPPANCAAADTGALIEEITLPSDWLTAASGGVKSLSGTWAGTSADVSGIPNHFRIKDSAGTTTHQQGTVGMNATAWAGSTVYAINDVRSNSGNIYRCIAAGTSAATGGPTGTGASIVDGGVTWTYLSVAGGDATLQNVDVQVGQAITVTAYTLTIGNA